MLIMTLIGTLGYQSRPIHITIDYERNATIDDFDNPR